jgi:hypothetical protein
MEAAGKSLPVRNYIHGGVVFDSVINYMDKFGPELLVIQFGFLVILSTLFLWLWFSNRRKYHNLKHAIPANVVKNYLDSIIQNSTALKSSLFRGGGLEVNGVPSVMPLTNLMGGESMGLNGAPSTALLEDINQKKALIASLEAQLSSTSGSQRELEAKLGSSQSHLSGAENKIKELEALLAQMKSGNGGGDAALKTELQMITKERDEIRDRLKEFEIISDDLANLKRLQQENEQLKRSLAAQGGSIPAPQEKPATQANAISQADVSDLLEDLGQTETAATDDNQALEDFLSSPDELSSNEPAEDTSEADMLAAMNEMTGASEGSDGQDNKPKSEKTPEDLLSEFEKMLG